MRGIIKVNKTGDPAMGNIERSVYNIAIYSRYSEEVIYSKDYETVKDIVFFDQKNARYYFKKDFSPFEIKLMSSNKCPGMLNYYHFNDNEDNRVYSAEGRLSDFKNKQIINEKHRFAGISKLKYTIGLEYETSLGFVPQDQCYINGLIPLRDGSISGPEYSTVILKGSEGINLIRQQLNVLKENTSFNKECSLHMHFGGYPVDPKYIFVLFNLYRLLEVDIAKYCNYYVFRPDRYKASGKNYCQSVQKYSYRNFNDLYSEMTGIQYFGNLNQPHPMDRDHNHKWQINARYRSLNLVNMICYQSPKTVEFRFLRPTYNFCKIYTWILIFNAILTYAEILTKKLKTVNGQTVYDLAMDGEIPVDLIGIIREVYSLKLANRIINNMQILYTCSTMQTRNGDNIGQDLSFENELLTDDYILK